MKWIFLAGLLAFIPTLAMLLRAQPKYLPHACFAMGFSVLHLDPYLSVAPISWPEWTSAVKGFEISLVDGIALSILLSTRRVRIPWAIICCFAIYVLAVVISTVFAQAKMPAFFHAWQLARAVLVFVATVRATATAGSAPLALAMGLGASIVIQGGVAIWQFASGVRPAGGTLGHQNMLGLASHFAALPALALFLAGRRTLAAGAIVLAVGCIAYVGSSRATIGLFAIGIVLAALLSIRHNLTGRKVGIALASFAALGLAAPALFMAIDRRTVEQRESSNWERRAFNEAAKMIIADHPLGVGGSQYVVVANLGGYLARAGSAWNQAHRAAPVHNSYYLVAAELGLLGLVGLIATLAAFFAVGLRALRRTIHSERSELLVGFLAALIVVSVHIGFEWLFMHWLAHYLLAMSAGAMIGIAVADRRQSPSGERSPRFRRNTRSAVPRAAAL